MNAFEEFPKIARLSRNCVITEKLDGTNAQVFIALDPNSNGDGERSDHGGLCVFNERTGQFYRLQAGSRTRWITPEQDNHGFAAWAYDNARALVDGLGEGRHFGEWWGSGIQRGYGLQKGEKRFSLFNVSRWADDRDRENFPQDRPAVCGVVPTLWSGLFSTVEVERVVESMAQYGSHAAPGFMNPEGVVVWHEAAGVLFKRTLHKDEEPKGKR